MELNNRGVKLAKSGQIQAAIGLFEEAADGMSGNKVVNLNAAKVLIMQMEQDGPSREYLNRARKYIDRTRNIVEHNLEDFLDDVLNEHRGLAEAQGIHIECQCDSFLNGFFDEDLVRGVLNNAVGNAARYSRNRLLIGAEQEDGYTVIRVQDNGAGFPRSMLDLHTESSPSTGFGQGRTRLGLHFADKVARLHKDKDRQGFIRLENGGQLQGGCFSIWLP